MATLPKRITVAEFRELPEQGEYVYELHDGIVVRMTRPKFWHLKIQRRIERLLQQRLSGFEAAIEMPYRPFGNYDLRVADVGAVTSERWNRIGPADDLQGIPDLVVEVKSPSNSWAQLSQLADLCLRHGALEFWIVDPEACEIIVETRSGAKTRYAGGASIPLAAFSAGSLPLDDVFSSL